MEYEKIEDEVGEAENIKRILEKSRVIDPLEFDDVYSPEEIERDLKDLEMARKKIRKSKEKMFWEGRKMLENEEKRLEALGTLLADQIYAGEWFGRNAMSVQTSDYDNTLRDVDIVVEFEQRDKIERMALTVDISTALDINQMEKKMKRNIERVIDNSLEVKYFQSQIADKNGKYFRGKIENLIPVIVGADRQNIDRIFNIFSELITLEERKDSESKKERRWLKEKLSRHPISEIFLKQARIQLEMYRSIILKRGDSAKAVKSLLETIKKAEKERKKIGFSSLERVDGDDVLNIIRGISQRYLPKESLNQ